MTKDRWLHGSRRDLTRGNVLRDQPRQDDFR